MDQASTTINSFLLGRSEYFQVGFGILVLTWLGSILRDIVYSIVDFVKSRFYYTARLSYPDSSFVQLLEWLGTQQHLFSSRQVSVMTRYQNIETAQDEGDLSVKLLPSGTQWFKFKRYLVSVTRVTSEQKSVDGVKDDYLDMRIYLGTKSTIEEILKTARDYSLEQNGNKTKIFALEPSSYYWECISCQLKREVNSVFLQEETRDLILKDLSSFIDGKKWYRDTGVPYRRGYLLYGPPGTGKTSFILSVAGKFGRSISIMNMNKGINDANINTIIQRCQKDTILVMEDIDAAFVDRSGQSSSKLSFSALLNAIDGLAASDGRILIMTTNHIEKLSPALIRPGRIDLQVEFGFATSYQVSEMFKRFFSEEYHHILPDIVKQLPEDSISTAQLQGWFISHRDDPHRLLKTVQGFVDRLASENEKSNSDVFVDENKKQLDQESEEIEDEIDLQLDENDVIRTPSRISHRIKKFHNH
ncbi:AAA ATPase domain-containing protein [Tieghemostelium lacteum]|uniref:AAA ATPase domain-containing protein n=1 Tax=Tieghemostelium lacteum TaxID=361077 RepID=A0A151Z6X8_TIELA|nr:AAA ATPase domain-containing protein [Tieghemostelium lacteum]|eukprot:KYQ89721.1 AAA ATPase domain-containing protein [Tieghemostelium lacteum]